MRSVNITTKYGVVTGTREGNSIIYCGIPYAAPPVGRLRFHAPQPPTPWNGELLCDQWPADSYRIPSPPNPRRKVKNPDVHTYSEDCLYLNIWMPAQEKEEPLPVMLWLYGAEGSSHDPHIDGTAYNDRGCILVSMNYRQNIFGCFGLEEFAEKDPNGSTGAYGIQDIVFALQWVRENIAAFGGDPENVTVFGHSAGAMFTKLLIGCKPARGLFRRGISLSGGGTWDIDVIQTKENKCRLCRQLLEIVGWTADDMMTRSAREIFDTLLAAEKELDLPKKSMVPTLFQPSMDDYLITDYYGKVLFDGDVDESVDVMCGMISEEWRNFPCQIPGGITGYEREFAMGSILAWGEAYAQRGIKPIYTYFFEHRLPGTGDWMVHGDELPYTFGVLDKFDRPWTDFDRSVSAMIVDYWTNFAKTGDPNGGALPVWSPYTKEAPMTMHFDDTKIVEKNIANYEKAREVVNYLLAHPGMLDDPFFE